MRRRRHRPLTRNGGRTRRRCRWREQFDTHQIHGFMRNLSKTTAVRVGKLKNFVFAIHMQQQEKLFAIELCARVVLSLLSSFSFKVS